MDRIKEIVKVSAIGVLTNLILVGFKATIGFLSGSIAIVTDAINNLSDAISSTVTIVGILLAGKKPDKKHPYGYGKIEYVSSLIVAIIIFATGISSLVEAVQKIITPELASFNPIMLAILFVGILAKFFLGRFVKSRGKKLNSASLVASGSDALFDVAISTSTLIGALISYFFGFSIDGWLGAIIAVFIIKTGVEIALESFDNIIGARIDTDLAKKIKLAVAKDPAVLGAYDLTLHQYGPEKVIGSVHIEVSDALTAKEIHLLTRSLSERIFKKYGVILTIGIYATNTETNEYAKIKRLIAKTIKNYPTILQMHGYYVDSEKNTISVDLVFDFKEKEMAKKRDEIVAALSEKYPGYHFNIVIDNDFAD